jgi:hypothetical protein
MFWAQPFDLNATLAGCEQQWGVSPDPYWAVSSFGGWRALRASTNILFSNGQLDPWKGGGVTQNVSESVLALVERFFSFLVAS